MPFKAAASVKVVGARVAARDPKLECLGPMPHGKLLHMLKSYSPKSLPPMLGLEIEFRDGRLVPPNSRSKPKVIRI